jgi:hypothetical protein
MIRLHLFVACLLLTAPAVSAQTVILPAPALDERRAALRDELLRFRDTLNTIDAAAARLQRDFRQASTASLLSRARVMRDACARSVRNVAPARTAVLAAEANDKRRLTRRAEMIEALDRLRGVLHRCQSDFEAMGRPGQEESVRGYGNQRAIQVQSALRQYERALASFFGAMGIKVRPLGARRSPVTG